MIEKHFRKTFPRYSPEVTIPIRNGKNPRFHEAMLWEFALGDLEQYILDIESIFPEIINFMKYRGTIRSMKLALSWVGFPSPTIVRLSRTSFEIDPGKPFNNLQTKAIQSACRQSAPATAALNRIFHKDQTVSF